jgi:Na+/proline symporter
VALTGIIATMPYIALQLTGMQVVIAALGLNYAVTLPLFGTVSVPLLAAFVVLAAYTYTSGLRGTALIAVVKDLLVYATVLAAVIVIPAELGGYGKVFASRRSQASASGPRHAGQSGRGLCLCHPGAGLDPGAVHVSPCGDGPAVILQPPCGQAQRHGAARLFRGLGADRACWATWRSRRG